MHGVNFVTFPDSEGLGRPSANDRMQAKYVSAQTVHSTTVPTARVRKVK